MTLINLRDVEDEQTIQERARAAIEADHGAPDEPIDPGLSKISKRRILNVDAVLARSLRRVTAEEV